MNRTASSNHHRKVLFLCSGNYYRSRFAEILFNHRAEAAGLGWRAESRAVDLPASRRYIRGPISPFCLEELATIGVPLPPEPRYPIQVREADLAGCEVVVAMKEDEHREPLERLFPAHRERIEYWHIHDIDCAKPAEALSVLQIQVEALIVRLQ